MRVNEHFEQRFNNVVPSAVALSLRALRAPEKRGESLRENGIYMRVNEHFEQRFNNVVPSAVALI